MNWIPVITLSNMIKPSKIFDGYAGLLTLSMQTDVILRPQIKCVACGWTLIYVHNKYLSVGCGNQCKSSCMGVVLRLYDLCMITACSADADLLTYIFLLVCVGLLQNKTFVSAATVVQIKTMLCKWLLCRQYVVESSFENTAVS